MFNNLFGKKEKSLEQLEIIVEKYNDNEDYKGLIDILSKEKITENNKNFVIGQLGRGYNNFANIAEEDDAIINNFLKAEEILSDLLQDKNCYTAKNLYYLAFTTYSLAWRGFEEEKYWLKTKDLLLNALELDPKHENTNKLVDWVKDEVYRTILDSYDVVFKNIEAKDYINYLSDSQLENYLFDILVRQVNNGGFIQLINNGYGHQIFSSPFIESIKLWGLEDLSKLLEKVKVLFLKNEKELTETTDLEAFSKLYKKFPEFEPYADQFFKKEAIYSLKWAIHILTNRDQFILSNDKINEIWDIKNNAITRWEFTDNLSDSEQRIYTEKCNAISDFWKDFETNLHNITAFLEKNNDFDISSFMNTHIHKIDDKLLWEFGSEIETKGHQLVFHKNGDLTAQPLLKKILSSAPKIENWEFYSHLLPISDASFAVKGRTGGNIEDFDVELFIDDKNNVISLEFYKKAAAADNDMDVIYISLDYILGEEIFSKWVGYIELKDKSLGKNAIPLSNLHDAFHQKIKTLKDSLPQKPFHQLENSWSLMKREPNYQADYAFQDDIYVVKTNYPDLWQTQHSNYNFVSERFSNFGEVFCYIKLDGANISNEELFKDKGDIEDALDEALIENNLGCFIGGGTGYRYSYIDLVLTDLEKGIDLIKKVMQQGKSSKNTWILFYDKALKNEWIGIWDDTPKPRIITIY